MFDSMETLANMVMDAQGGDSGIVTRFKDDGGEVIVFTDNGARSAYHDHVRNFDTIGTFTYVVENEDGEIEVEVNYARF